MNVQTAEQSMGKALANASAPDRSATDFFPTPAPVTEALLRFLDLPPLTIWEPACGEGHMSRVLEAAGHEVISTDLYSSDYTEGGVDFLATHRSDMDMVITNPPFKASEAFIRHSFDLGVPFAMLLKSQYWHSSGRRRLFHDRTPRFVLPLTWRPDFHFGSKGGSPTMEVLWTVWNADPSETTFVPLERP